MSFKWAFVNFFQEKRGRRVVKIIDIEGFNPKHHQDFDEHKTVLVSWPYLRNEGSFSTESLYEAKILCIGVDVDDLTREAKRRQLKLPEMSVPQQDQKVITTTSSKGRTVYKTSSTSIEGKKTTIRKRKGNKVFINDIKIPDVSKKVDNYVKDLFEPDMPRKASAKEETCKKGIIKKNQEKIPEHHKKKTRKMTPEDDVRFSRAEELLSKYGHSFHSLSKSPCKTPNLLELTPQKSEMFVVSPKFSESTFQTPKLKMTVSPKFSESTFQTPKLRMTPKMFAHTIVTCDQKSQGNELAAMNSFHYDCNFNLPDDIDVPNTDLKSSQKEKIRRSQKTVNYNDESSSNSSLEYVDSDEEKDLLVKKVFSLETTNKKLNSTIKELEEKLSEANIKITEHKAEVQKYSQLALKLSEKIAFQSAHESDNNIEGMGVKLNVPVARQLSFPSGLNDHNDVTRESQGQMSSPKTPNTESDANDVTWAISQSSATPKKSSGSKRKKLDDPREVSIDGNEVIASKIIKCLDGVSELEYNDKSKVNIGNDVFISSVLWSDKIRKPTCNPAIALRDAVNNVYSVSELAERSLEGGMPVKGDKSVTKKRLTPRKREAILGLFRAKTASLSGNRDKFFLDLAVQKKRERYAEICFKRLSFSS